MSGRLKKAIRVLLAFTLLVAASAVQTALNGDRERLGLTRVEPLENAPPLLAFTTVALGGFRGLISNALWIRASELQDEDKFFEMAQLADWITKLEPHYAQVWAHQAWNMAYNISVKFKESKPGEYPDRWRWVQRGIELLRDEGLKYNPNDVLLYQQLAILFQHKMGANLDDANVYYKEMWAREMADVLGKPKPNLDELIQPQTDEAKARAKLLREKYNMDPEFMKRVDGLYGPLEWRLPEAHAIYWAAVGLKKARENPTRVNPDDLIMLRRVIYQSTLISFQRGRLVANPFTKQFDFGPDLDLVPRANAVYEQMMAEDEKARAQISIGHRNFLKQAVYSLYLDNRLPEAAQWYRYLGQHYPDKPLIESDTNSLPGRLTLEQFAIARLRGNVGDTDRNGIKALIEGLFRTAFVNLALGEDNRAVNMRSFAHRLWESYQSRIRGSEARIGLPPIDDIETEVRNRMLDPETGLPSEVRAVLLAKLGLKPESPTSPVLTNAPPAAATNAPSGATEKP